MVYNIAHDHCTIFLQVNTNLYAACTTIGTNFVHRYIKYPPFLQGLSISPLHIQIQDL